MRASGWEEPDHIYYLRRDTHSQSCSHNSSESCHLIVSVLTSCLVTFRTAPSCGDLATLQLRFITRLISFSETMAIQSGRGLRSRQNLPNRFSFCTILSVSFISETTHQRFTFSFPSHPKPFLCDKQAKQLTYSGKTSFFQTRLKCLQLFVSCSCFIPHLLISLSYRSQ